MPMATEQGMMQIYFSDFFRVSPRILQKYGAFNISLINGLPLFVDPFLVFNSDKPEYRQLHGEIIKRLQWRLQRLTDDLCISPRQTNSSDAFAI
jgi:hypothetical protein